jgi:dihydropteroate synthase
MSSAKKTFPAAPKIMGILNLTPDSFSDGGKFLDLAESMSQARLLASGGAEIIDLGAESTAPGSRPVSAEVEIQRLAPVLPLLTAESMVSVDTYKSQTARYALENAARIINDVSGLMADPELPFVVRDFDAQLVIMFNKESGKLPHASSSAREYSDVVQEIADELLGRVDRAVSAGIPSRNIILDPGMGKFISHREEYSWELLARLEELVLKLRPFPILIGTSRKGFLGGALAERDSLSQLTALAAALKGVSYIRTHNPTMMREFWLGWMRCQTPDSMLNIL